MSTEWALLVPVLLTLVMLVVQFGLAFHAGQVADAAADEGLEAAQAERGSVAAGITLAQTFAEGDGVLAAPQVDVQRDASTVTVTVTGGVPAVVPGVTLQVARTASGPIEQFVPVP